MVIDPTSGHLFLRLMQRAKQGEGIPGGFTSVLGCPRDGLDHAWWHHQREPGAITIAASAGIWLNIHVGPIWALARSSLRGRSQSAITMAIVIALAGGVALGALAGARRTDSAIGRFVTYFRPAQGQIEAPTSDFPAIARLPDVAATEAGAFMLLVPLDKSDRVDRSFQLSTIALLDHLDFSRPLVLAGRLPRATDINEVVVNPSAAIDGHLHVGSTVRLRAFEPSTAQQVLQGTDEGPTGPKIFVRVVGIVRTPSDLSVAPTAPGVVFEGQDEMLFTPAFFQRNGAKIANAGVGLSYRLKGGEANLSTFVRSVNRRSGSTVQVQPGSDDLAAAANAQHAAHLEALALLIFGILAILLTFTMVAQGITRQVYFSVRSFATLRALGMKRSQLALTGGAGSGLTVVAGVLGAAAVAILVSPAMPIGLARQAEIDPGFSADWFVLLLGLASLVVVLVGWAFLAAWREAGRAGLGAGRNERTRQSSSLAGWLRGSGLPPTTVLGIQMALESPPESGSVPLRTMWLSAVVGITALCATLTFGASLNRLASEPQLQGWTWDVSVGNPHSDDIAARADRLLSSNGDVAGFSAVALSPSNVEFVGREGSVSDGLFGIRPVKGSVLPPFTRGRAPRTSDEIAFGATTLRELGLGVGDDVEVTNGQLRHQLRITGQMVLNPSVVNDQVPFGHGALMTLGGLKAVHAGAPVNVFLVRFVPRVDRTNALAKLNRQFPGTVLGPLLAPDIENLRRVDNLPGLLAALVALVALLTVGHTMAISARYRRQDVAVLRTLGFVRSQVAAMVAWQATTVVAIGLLVGIPVGLIAGRWAWTLVTNQLGLPQSSVTPGLLVLVGISLLAANLIAVIPGLTAARTRPSSVLRTE